MKRSKLLGIVCAVAMIAGLLVAGCAGEGPPTEGPPTEGPPEEVFELTIGTQHPYEAAMNRVINEAWIRWLERESEGRIKVTLLHSEQAAKGRDLYDAARTGIVDIACQSYNEVPGRFSLTEVVMLPMIFEAPASRTIPLVMMELYNKYPEIQAQFPDVKVLCFHSTDVSQFITIDKPIQTLKDMEGFSMATVSGPWDAKAITLLGGIPSAPAIGESYDTLAKHVVDGMSCNYEGIFVWHYNEVCDYCTQAGTCGMPFVHVMNLDTWNSLPADLQELFVGENAWTMMNLYGHQFDEDCKMFASILNEQFTAAGYPEIYILPDAERARWIEAIQPVWEEWVSEADAAGAPGRAILEDALMFGEQYAYTYCQECEDTLHEWGAEGHQ